jgi:hypothetical protein
MYQPHLLSLSYGEKYKLLFNNLTLQTLYIFFVSERNCMNLSQIVSHTWEICLLPLEMLK